MKIKKRCMAVSLLEIMIVIFIIGIIGGVVSYNMKGSLDEGRSFKSEQGSKQIHDILTLKLADGAKFTTVIKKPVTILEQSGFIKNAKKLFKDGWNNDFVVQRVDDERFIVYSDHWKNFLVDKKKMSKKRLEDDYPWAFHFDQEEYEEEEEE